MNSRTTNGQTESELVGSRLRKLLLQAVDLISALEHGQDQRILTSHLLSLLRELDSPSLRLLILPVDENARSWSDNILPSLPHGVRLSSADGQSSDAKPDVRCEWILPDSLLLQSADLTTTLAKIHGILIVDSDGVADGQFSDRLLADIAAVQHRAGSIALYDRVPQGNGLSLAGFRMTALSGDALSISSWASSLGSEEIYPAILKRFIADMELVNRLIQDQLQKCECRKRIMQVRGGPMLREDQENVRITLESLRRLWEDQFNAVELALNQAAHEKVLPQSRIANRFRNLQDDLCIDDLQMEQAGRTIRLAVNEDFRRRAGQMIRNSLHEIVSDTISGMEGQLQIIRRDSHALMLSKTDAVCEFEPPEWDVAGQIATLERRIDLELRYAGEIPRKNWFDWLSQGRRPVFAVTMIVSIFGTALGWGSGRVGFLAPMMAVLFLTGMCWAIWEFRGERQRLLHREVTRLRDVVQRELSRSLDELVREWQAYAVRVIRDSQKDWLRQLADWDRQQQAQRNSNLEQARASHQEQLRGMERQDRELGQLKIQLERLQIGLQELVR